MVKGLESMRRDTQFEENKIQIMQESGPQISDMLSYVIGIALVHYALKGYNEAYWVETIEISIFLNIKVQKSGPYHSTKTALSHP